MTIIAAVTEYDIRRVLLRRSDISPFLVHFTRNTPDGKKARRNLTRILKTKTLEARNPFGNAKHMSGKDRDSQRCVSFSEVPLEYINCLTLEIPKRQIHLSCFGLAFSKMRAREKGCNPVWYLDITPGHEFLTKSVDKLITTARKEGKFRDSPVARICPFIEHMGTGVRQSDGKPYQKEFWWEREWRHAGDFTFSESDIAFGFAPEAYIDEFEELMRHRNRRSLKFVDPTWSTDQIIAHLARYTGNLSPFDPPRELY